MPRVKKRKTENHGQTDPMVMKRAVKMVLDGESIRTVAKATEVSKSTLQRYVTVAKTAIGIGEFLHN